MFLSFFTELRQAGLPVSLREYLDLTAAVQAGAADFDVDRFYFLARAALVKDERFFDRYDRVFGAIFGGLDLRAAVPEARALPEDWLRTLADSYLGADERRRLDALGWEALMATLQKRLDEQSARHEGGDKWIGTRGRSPFGAFGAAREGVRIGQGSGRGKSAVKVWDRREYKDLDEDEALGPRNLKLALRRLRKFARAGAAEELDLDATIHGTATKAYLDLRLRPERRNAIKVLLFLDNGGSMDEHVGRVQQLFAAAKAEFKHLQHFYFHNCLYDGAWTSNARRFVDRTSTLDVIRTYPRDYKVIFVGDATMSPYEISMPGGAVEFTNAEAGAVWMQRVTRAYPRCVWLNPIAERDWPGAESIQMIRALMDGRMFPLTLAGLDAAVKQLLH